MPSLNAPIEQDLGTTLTVLFSAGFNLLMFSDIWTLSGISTSSYRAVSDRCDVVFVHELYQHRLNTERMKLNLIASWRDPRIAQHIPQGLDVEIGDSDASYETLVNK
jgi:hypothetical protein